MKHYSNLVDLCRDNECPLPEHPMIGLVRCNKSCSLGDRMFTTDMYMIGFKKLRSGMFFYGRTKYDHDNGSMSFVKPRQTIKLENLEFEEDGFLILIHEDALHGHPLFHEIKKYNFFEYETSEALHLSPSEEKTIWELFYKIESEYYNTQDEYSRDIIFTHIDSILKYSQRFYKRQFINRATTAGSMATRFEAILSGYFDNGLMSKNGLPTVHYMAEQLNLSPRYLSDVLKQETGKTAIDWIHIRLVNEAKNMLKSADQTVAEIAYLLGFENPPYFSRLFKKEVGISPNQYKKQYEVM